MPLISLDLPAQPTAVARARAALDELEPRVEDHRLIELRLLVSEVVTNAVRHAHQPEPGRVRLLIDACHCGLRVEVHDGGPGFAAPAAPAPRAEGTSGWGLFFVARLARRWGSEPAPDAHVWFEFAT